MPLTIPSTAWSSAASSKTMFAALPPSSSVSFLPVPASRRWIALPTSVEPVNAILSTSASTSAAPVRAVAGDDVDDARRQLGLAEHVAEEQRGERRRLGRLQHDGVAGGERGRELPREHQQREVPRDDLPGDAERPRRAVRERVLELVGPAGVVEEVRGGERQVDVARLLDRLAAVQRLEHRELARALLRGCARSGTGTSRARARAASTRCRTPRAPPRPRASTSSGPACATSRERLLVARRDRREALARARLDPLAADEQAVALLQRDDVARLGRRRVRPVGRHRREPAARFDSSSVIREVVLRLVGARLLLAHLHQDVVERGTTRRAGRGRASASRGRASRAPGRGTGSRSSTLRIPPAAFMPTRRPVSS